MIKKQLISLRKCDPFFYNEVMFEWEDDLSRKGFTIKCRSQIEKYFWLLFHKFGNGKIKQSKNPSFAFLMFVSQYSELFPKNIIPIFVDTRVKGLPVLEKAISDLDIAIITNRQAYYKMKKIYPEKRLYSIPLWVSDKWRCDKIPSKSIDVLQLGRKNKILHNYMLRYLDTHPEVEYIYQMDDGSRRYISTRKGILGTIDTREDFINTLRSTKISLVSSPLADTDDSYLDFITPRVYESAASYCYMIGRFTQNDEFNDIGLAKVCKIADNQEVFNKYVDMCLNFREFAYKTEFDAFLNDNNFAQRYNKVSSFLNL